MANFNVNYVISMRSDCSCMRIAEKLYYKIQATAKLSENKTLDQYNTNIGFQNI